MLICVGCQPGGKNGSKSNAESGDLIEAKGSEFVEGLKLKNLKNKTLRVTSGSSLEQLAAINFPDSPQTFYHALVVWEKTYGVEVILDNVNDDDLVAMYAADDMPDVIGPGTHPELLMDLTDLIDSKDSIYHNEYSVAYPPNMRSKIAFIKTPQRKYIVFNESRFVNEGQKTPLQLYKEGKWTWTQFVATAKAMTDAANDKYGFTGNELGHNCCPYPLANWDDAGRITLDFKNPKLVNVLSAIVKLNTEAKAQRTDNGSSNWREHFLKGKDAMLITNEYEFSEICRKSELAGGDDFGIAPMFTFDITGETKPFYDANSMVRCISSKSKNPEGAAEFIKIMAYVNSKFPEKMGQFESADKYLTDDERTALKEQLDTSFTVQPLSYVSEECAKNANLGASGYNGNQLTGNISATLDAYAPQIQQEVDEYNSKIK